MPVLQVLTRDRWFWIRAVVVPAICVFALFHMFRGNGYADTGPFACAALIVLIADLATFVGGLARNLLVMLASLVLGLGVIDGIADAMLPQIDIVNPKGLWGPNKDLGWGPTAPGRYEATEIIDGKLIYKINATIDDDLLRATYGDRAGPKIAWFGDSFTFGNGLNDADTLPQAFADLKPGLDTINIAYSGYSPAQVLREMQLGLFDKRIGTPKLFILQTAPWHAERTSCRLLLSATGPHYVVKDGEPAFAGPCASGPKLRLETALKAQAFYRVFLEPIFLRPNHAEIGDWIAIVNAITRVAKEKYKVPMVVLYRVPPDHYLDGLGYTDAQIKDALRAGGAHVIDTDVATKPGDVMEIPGDGHPTGLANRLVARKLVDDLDRTMPGVLKAGSQ